MAQLAFQHRLRELEDGIGLGGLPQHALPLHAGHEMERMVLQLAVDAGVDGFAFEVGVGLYPLAGDALAGVLPEADRSLHQLLAGEDPVEAVELPFFLARVVLERALDGGDDRRLGAAVRSVQQDELVDPAGSHEPVQDPVDRVLHLFVSADGRPALPLLQGARPLVEGPVEELESAHRAARVVGGGGAVEVEAVPDVLGRVASVDAGLLEEAFHVLLEGEDGLVADESVAHLLADALQVAQRIHHASLAPR